MIVGVAALFQIVDIICAILVVRHGIAYKGLLDAVFGGTEEVHILVSILLTAGRTQGRKVLVSNALGEGHTLILRRGSLSGFRGVVSTAGKQQANQNKQCNGRNQFLFHGNLLIEG